MYVYEWVYECMCVVCVRVCMSAWCVCVHVYEYV